MRKTKTRFTPGPWMPAEDTSAAGPVGYVVVGDGLLVEVRAGAAYPAARADAHLIAAAPDLYEACDRALALLAGQAWCHDLNNALRAALAKARGEAP